MISFLFLVVFASILLHSNAADWCGKGSLKDGKDSYWPGAKNMAALKDPHFHCVGNKAFVDHGSSIQDGNGNVQCDKVKENIDAFGATKYAPGSNTDLVLQVLKNVYSTDCDQKATRVADVLSEEEFKADFEEPVEGQCVTDQQ